MYHIRCCVGNRMEVMRTRSLLSMWWRGGLVKVVEWTIIAWNARISVRCPSDKSELMQSIPHALCKNSELNMLHSLETKR